MNSSSMFELVRRGDIVPFREQYTSDALAMRGPNGQTLLHEAVSFSKNEIAKELIKNGIGLDVTCKKHQTALHYASIYKNLELVMLFVQLGSAIDPMDIHGNGPAWYAAIGSGNPTALEILNLLKAHGANMTRKNLAGRCIADVLPPV